MQNTGLDVVRRVRGSTPRANRATAREQKGTLPFRNRRLAFCGGGGGGSGIARKRSGKFSHLSADSIPANTKYQRACTTRVFTSKPKILVILIVLSREGNIPSMICNYGYHEVENRLI